MAAAPTPFDAALAELLRAWQEREALRDAAEAGASVDLAARTATWLALDRARTWVASFEGAGRQPGLPGPARPRQRSSDGAAGSAGSAG